MRTYHLAWGLAAIGGTLLYRKMLRSGRGRQWEQHQSESKAHYRHAGTRVLILGGGFGGLAAALQLDRQLLASDDVSVLVVDRNNDLLFTPLLWTVSSGRANPNNVVVPIRKFQRGRRFHVLHTEIEHIDLDKRIVYTSADERPYDILVIALGSYTTVPDLPGLREYALPFHTPADALQLRNHLIDAVEAAHHTDDPEERQSWLTFVIGGAGDTGIELAATIHEYLVEGLFREYPWLVDAPMRVILVGRAERILPMGDPDTAQRVQEVLTKEGIEILTGTSITGVTEKTVETNAGSIPARTLFWAAGITAPDVVRQLPVKHAPNGAIFVDDFLRIPEYSNVYVIGDVAWAYDSASGSPVPPTAQASDQQGKYVGKTIAMQYAGRTAKPYCYVPLGHLALLGRHTAVARVRAVTFTGLPAWVFWHIVYLGLNPSWSKRVRLVVDWLLSTLLGRETGQLRLDVGLPRRKKVLEKI